ncbi:MAG TPA: TetR/AcrR family transcriptional regulator [Ktedonobacteraceae bacterium]|jgi:AcrR family transcriptional regulator
MSEPDRGRRRKSHDAEGTREALLNAAETIFAEHGFDGARVDAIATLAGCNKSLIFQYFGDKLNLYVEVIRRADREMSAVQNRLLASLHTDASAAFDPERFKDTLAIIVGTLFDYLVEHPRLIRMLSWEQAEGWETYTKTFAQFETDDNEQFATLFRAASEAGFLRSDLSALFQVTIALQVSLSYLSWKPLYEIVFPHEDFSSGPARARLREYIVNFIIAGICNASREPGRSP